MMLYQKEENINWWEEKQDWKTIFEPTIVTNINTKMKIFNNENFGPIIPVINFKSDDELIQLANDTNYGLQIFLH